MTLPTDANGKVLAGPGRPSSFTEEVGERICELLEQGVALTAISRMPDMPHFGTIYRWLEPDYSPVPDSFRKAFWRARKIHTHYLVTEALEIADDKSGDTKLVGKMGEEYEVCDTEFVQRSKVRIETRFRVAGLLNKAEFGDKRQVELTGADGQPLKTENINHNMTPREAAEAYAASLRDEE
jgi:hypothetical protein